MRSVFILLSIIAVLTYCVNADDEEETPTDKSVCSLPKDIGPCRSSKVRYYYDSKGKACKEFFYGGCMGNGNRFEALEDCQKLCIEA